MKAIGLEFPHSTQHHSLMAFFCHCHRYSRRILFMLAVFLIGQGASGATFTFVNNCEFTVWPGILGSPKLDSTGFELEKGGSRSFQAPSGWSGRFWGRTSCNFDSSGRGVCATGDCGSGEVECNGASATPPATLAEFTLGSGSQDFYDVSLVDGYNLPMIVEGTGGSGPCETTGCVSDLNQQCPTELRAEGGGACRSACEAFGTEEYCCSGAYNSPATCKPSMYSQMFKSACPKSYSYAYDDATSTFTCTGADYTITFCPSSPSLKSARDSSAMMAGGTTGDATGSVPGAAEQTSSTNIAWLANLATGDSTRPKPLTAFHSGLIFAVSLSLSFFRSQTVTLN